MTAAQRMRERLNATGCYRLTGESSADWETDACGAGIDGVDEEIDALVADLFPATAGEEQLARWESLFRPDVSTEDLEVRREMIIRRLAMSPGLFRPEDYSALIQSAGLIGNVIEGTVGEDQTPGVLVLASKVLGLTEEEIRRELDQLLPAHLPWEWQQPLNWTALDAWLPDFDTIDKRLKTWYLLDNLTMEQLKNY